jgi:predicted Zn-dependent protease
MPKNELHHGYTLTSLFIEAKFAKSERHWSRYGRRGETNGGSWIQDARKRYNKAHRKASRVQLNRYQTPVEEYHPVFTWPEELDFSDDYFILGTTNQPSWEE